MPSTRVRTKSETFAITAVTHQRRRIFQRSANADLMIATLFRYREEGRFLLHGFVVMPDHIHVLLTPAPDNTIERCIQLIKGGFTFAIRKEFAEEVWQNGYHAHRITSLDDYDSQLRYIANNPSRKNLTPYPHIHTNHIKNLDPFRSAHSRMNRITALLLILLPLGAPAQHITNPKASLIDIPQRHQQLATNQDPRTAQAIASLKSCTALPPIPAPTGRMIIPHHYLSGSHGPTNPAEAVATRVYNEFERRITAGMNQWLVTSSKDEAQCAQQQIDTWAQAGALLDYDPKESSQAWYQVEWTLSATAISESVLVNEPSLDQSVVKRDIQWMNKVAHRTVEFDKEGKQTNNHHYWRGLAATSVGVLSSDDNLFNWGIGVYKQAINELDQRGALPQEMARHERAIHYQSFALQPLTPLAAFAEQQHIPLYSYRSPSGKTITDAVNFLGDALANPEIVKVYTPDQQLVDDLGSDFFAFAEYYSHYSKAPLPPTILKGLERPTFATRIGGSTTVIDGYVPNGK